MKHASQHNYVNPAFCQQSEFPQTENRQFKNVSNFKVNRSQSIHSINDHQISAKNKNDLNENNCFLNLSSPPKPGSNFQVDETRQSGRYALVPVEALEKKDINVSYPILPLSTNISSFLKSQQNIDCFSSLPVQENLSNFINNSFSSAPPNQSFEQPRLYNAFSSDFGATSFVIHDNKKIQRYEVIPTDDDEEIVDNNHEIIQMHNGRAHRYAIIHAEEEEENNDNNLQTKKENGDWNFMEKNVQSKTPVIRASSFNRTHPTTKQSSFHNYATMREVSNFPSHSTPKKSNIVPQHKTPTTPSKNLATIKLHELLSTPLKHKEQTPVHYSPQSIQLQRRVSHVKTNLNLSESRSEFMPQKLQYDQEIYNKEGKRTTAVITPRLILSPGSATYNEVIPEPIYKTSQKFNFNKANNAILTIAVISFMLFICGMLNIGLVIYLIYTHGKSFFMELGLISAIASLILGVQGFRSRKYILIPNRNYISGYLLITIFSLLNCCGFLALLLFQPFPGSPLHDVTSGIILGLSTLTLLLISLGIIISKWCTVTPPDNRIDLC